MFPVRNIQGPKRTTTLFQESPQHNTLRPDGPLGGAKQASGQLKEVRARIKSIKETEKITKTMKMIASSRMKASQTKLQGTRPFTQGTSLLNESVPVDTTKGNLIVGVFADRGLCGGINSFVSRHISTLVRQRREASPTATFQLTFLGNKGNILTKNEAERLIAGARDVGKPLINFTGVSQIAESLATLPPTEAATIVYNKFENAAQFTTSEVNIPGRLGLNVRELDQFEWEEDQALFQKQDLYEFTLAATIFGGVMENATSELSARMTAMDNASRNASEILKRLNVFYNRGRQAAITTELSEIIGGAAALSG